MRKTQAKLADRIGAQVRSARSASSLQLALENEKLFDAQKGYVAALKPAGEDADDIIGYVFAINGELNSADVYASNGLFRKMWGKLLNASAIEAIGHRNEPSVAPPAIEQVTAFLAAAQAARQAKSRSMPACAWSRAKPTKLISSRPRGRQSPGTPLSWVHRNYLAK